MPTETIWTPEQLAKARLFNSLNSADRGSEADEIDYALRAELGAEEADRLLDYVEQNQLFSDEPVAPKPEPKSPRQNSLIRENLLVPVRSEDWIESLEYPGIWVNGSGEVMHGATGKVRTLQTAFNPKSRKYSTRVWLSTELGYAYHQELLVERQKTESKRKKERSKAEPATLGKRAGFPYSS